MRAWLLAAVLAIAPRAADAQTDGPREILALRQKLAAHDWPGLERELEARRPRSPAEMQFESRFVFAFDAFATTNPVLLRHLDAWVAASPSAALPRVARGIYFARRGELANSQAIEDRPSDPAARDGSRWLARAIEEGRAATRLDSSEVMGYLLLLGMSALLPDGQAEAALKGAITLWPASLLARAYYMEALIPRQGGSVARMAGFADSAQRLVATNPRLRVLRGMAEFDRGRELAYAAKHTEAIAAYTRAIAVHDYWLFRYERAMEYGRLDDQSRALIDLNRALAERPGYARSVAARAVALGRLGLRLPGGRNSPWMRRADEQSDIALALDSQDEVVSYLLGEPGGHPVTPAPHRTVVVRLDPTPPLDRPEDMLALRRLLVSHEFARLDSAFAARAGDARSDISHEPRYLYAFDIFDTADSSLAPHLDAWIAHDSSRAVPWVARGTYFGSLAQHARGGAYAAKVKDEQWKGMRKWLGRSAADAARAALLDRTDVAAHQVLLDVALFSGNDALGRRVLEDALTRQPASLSLPVTFMSSLRPRWGGSIEELNRFAALAQREVRANPRLTVLLGMADFERGETLWDNDEYQAAAAEYTKALSHGDFWRYFYRRGRAYLGMEEFEKALQDLDRAVNRRPGAAPVLAFRAVAYDHLSELEVGEAAAAFLRSGQRDLRTALLLDPADDEVQWVRDNYPRLSAASAASAAGR